MGCIEGEGKGDRRDKERRDGDDGDRGMSCSLMVRRSIHLDEGNPHESSWASTSSSATWGWYKGDGYSEVG